MQRITVKKAKLRRHQQRIEQFRQSIIFDFDQKMYAEFNEDELRPNAVPNADEIKRFWGDILSV